MTTKSLDFDNQLRKDHPILVGCDEVGRGCLAGPIVTAAVILKPDVDLPAVTDSKKINKHEHAQLAHYIFENAVEIQYGLQNADVIDKYNILEADKMAMRDMIAKLHHQPDLILIDGNEAQLLNTDYPEQTIIKGDFKSLSIGAASIMAKYLRDRLMAQYDDQYPGYGFAHNDGYGTKEHRQALSTLGITPIHRKTFAPVKNHLHDWPINNGQA